MQTQLILDVENWFRLGRGRGFDFRIVTDQLVSLLKCVLRTEYAPYSLIVVELVKRGDVYVEQAHEGDILDLSAVSSPDQWQFFIRSCVLTGDIDFGKMKEPLRFCSFNGLINLQHGRVIHGNPDASSIGIVDRVATNMGDRVVQHVDYLKIFQGLRRSLQPFKARAW